MPEVHAGSYKEAILFLVTAGIVVPLFHRLRISPVLGFIGAGALLGPFGLGRLADTYPSVHLFTIGNRAEIAHLAEFGVIFLMFMIGIELSWERLRVLRRLVFGLGSLQVGCSALILGAILYGLGVPLTGAAIVGIGLALSSTAVVLPVLAEQKRLNAPTGRTSFAVLLFQDLAVAPVLFAIAVLGRDDGGDKGWALAMALGQAAIALVLIVVAGRLALRPLFQLVARTRSTELFMAACLLVIVGTALTAAASGLSMTLGAFVAGLLLAETEYRRAIEATIDPFKGLLLGVFFVSVGMNLDPAQLMASPGAILGLSLALVLIKAAVVMMAAPVLKIPRPVAPALPVIRHWVAEGLARDAEQRRLFPWLAVAFGGGILVYFAATDGAPSLAAPLVAAALALAPIPLLGARPAALAAVLAVAAAFLGFAAAAWRVSEVAAPVLNRTTIGPLIGTVEALDEREVGARLLIRVESFAGLAPEARPARVRVSFRKTPTPLPGDVVAATARLLPPPEAARPGGYDFARDAYFQGIGAVGSLVGAVTIRAPTEPPPLRLRLAATLDAARNGLTRRIAEAAGGQAGAVAAALVTGKRGLIGPATNDALRAAGIYHVVSISGLHMVLAAGVVFWLVRALLALVPHCALLWPIKKIAAGFAMVGVTAYCAFSGWDIAAERSLIMTLIMLGAILVDRPALSMRNLALAALIALAREPEGLLGPSFQMSFGAVAGLIACARLIDGRLFVRPGAGRLGRLVGTGLSAVTGTLATTLVAQVATAPFATYHFQTIQPFGLVGNALTLPLVSLVVMPSAVIGILAYPFALDRPIWWLMGQAVGGMLAVSHWIAGFERAIVVVPAFGTAALFLLTAGLLLATLPASRLRWLAVPPILLGLVVAARPDRYDLYVDRQGAGAAVRGPDGRLAALGSPSGFVLEQWLKADGDGRGAGALIVRSGSGRCDRLGCTARLPDGRAVALVRDRRAFPEDCARAAVLITGLVAPPTCTGPLVIDRRVLAAQGAVALRSDGESFVAHHARADGRAVPWRPRSGHGPGPPQLVTAPSAEARASDDGATTPLETDASGGDFAPGDAPAEPLQ